MPALAGKRSGGSSGWVNVTNMVCLASTSTNRFGSCEPSGKRILEQGCCVYAGIEMHIVCQCCLRMCFSLRIMKLLGHHIDRIQYFLFVTPSSGIDATDVASTLHRTSYSKWFLKPTFAKMHSRWPSNTAMGYIFEFAKV